MIEKINPSDGDYIELGSLVDKIDEIIDSLNYLNGELSNKEQID